MKVLGEALRPTYRSPEAGFSGRGGRARPHKIGAHVFLMANVVSAFLLKEAAATADVPERFRLDCHLTSVGVDEPSFGGSRFGRTVGILGGNTRFYVMELRGTVYPGEHVSLWFDVPAGVLDRTFPPETRSGAGDVSVGADALLIPSFGAALPALSISLSANGANATFDGLGDGFYGNTVGLTLAFGFHPRFQIFGRADHTERIARGEREPGDLDLVGAGVAVGVTQSILMIMSASTSSSDETKERDRVLEPALSSTGFELGFWRFSRGRPRMAVAVFAYESEGGDRGRGWFYGASISTAVLSILPW